MGPTHSYSFIGGGANNTCNSSYSAIPGGQGCTTASPYSFACGKYNKTGQISGFDRIFMVGGGSNVTTSNYMSITTNGNMYFQGSLTTSTTADYAEYFESDLTEKIPLGTSVTFTGIGKKIKIATGNDIPYGVISDSGALIANGAEEEWSNKWIYQDVTEDVYETECTEKQITKDVETIKNNGIHIDTITETIKEPVTVEVDVYKNGVKVGTRSVPKKIKTGTQTVNKRVINPDFDPTKQYIPRSQRPGWNIVGLMGVVKVIKTTIKSPQWVRIGDCDDVYDYYLIK